MLALTDSAVQAVTEIVSSSDEASETGGLRMVAKQAGTQVNFQLSVVPVPAEDDEVIEEQGARVFLEPDAASLLDDKVLDAKLDQNQVAFTTRGPDLGKADLIWHGEVVRLAPFALSVPAQELRRSQLRPSAAGRSSSRNRRAVERVRPCPALSLIVFSL